MSEPEETAHEVSATPSSGVDPRLLEILICPMSRKPLAYDRERNELVSKPARLAYRIRGGIPVMLPEEARDLDEPDTDGVGEVGK